jgi:transcriptional regulator with XRE-family HTH domain
VSRWEAGAVMPDIDKISDIADILDVSCDYLLKDDAADEKTAALKGPSRLLAALVGTKVKLKFFDEETDADLYDAVCTILELEGNWMKIKAETKKGTLEKLIPVSSVLSFEEVKEV